MSLRRLETPCTAVVDRRDDFIAEAKVRDDAVLDGDLFEIGMDLVTGREHPGEVRVRRERVRIDVRRHVTCDAGIGVLAPSAANAIGLLETDDVGDAGLAQLDHREDPGHAGADHADAQRSPSHALGLRHAVSPRTYAACRPAIR